MVIQGITRFHYQQKKKSGSNWVDCTTCSLFSSNSFSLSLPFSFALFLPPPTFTHTDSLFLTLLNSCFFLLCVTLCLFSVFFCCCLFYFVLFFHLHFLSTLFPLLLFLFFFPCLLSFFLYLFIYLFISVYTSDLKGFKSTYPLYFQLHNTTDAIISNLLANPYINNPTINDKEIGLPNNEYRRDKQ